MITILAESERKNPSIARKQLKVIEYELSKGHPLLVVIEMSPLLLWIMQDKIFKGEKNVSKLSKYINPIWIILRKQLTQWALEGKIYLMSYDVVQILDYRTIEKAKDYFGIDLPNPWKCFSSQLKNNKQKNGKQIDACTAKSLYIKENKKKLDIAIELLRSFKLKKYDTPFATLHNYIFKQMIKNLHVSYDGIGEYCDRLHIAYMVTRDTAGTKYLNKLLSKFANLTKYDMIILCHVINAYYSHDPKTGEKYTHEFEEGTNHRFIQYSNLLEPFAGNLKGDKKNIILIDGNNKFHERSIEYQLIKIARETNKTAKTGNNKLTKTGNNKLTKLDNKKSYWLQSCYIMIHPTQFDYFLIA